MPVIHCMWDSVEPAQMDGWVCKEQTIGKHQQTAAGSNVERNLWCCDSGAKMHHIFDGTVACVSAEFFTTHLKIHWIECQCSDNSCANDQNHNIIRAWQKKNSIELTMKTIRNRIRIKFDRRYTNWCAHSGRSIDYINLFWCASLLYQSLIDLFINLQFTYTVLLLFVLCQLVI